MREVQPITGEQIADIFSIIVSEFPHMTFDEAQAIIDNDEEFAADITFACAKYCAKRREAKSRRASKLACQYDVSNIPADGVEFELTLEADFTDPKDMLRESDQNPRYWKHVGRTLTGRNTGRFKLVRAGYRDNIRGVRAILNGYGKIPPSQWLQAFRDTFQLSDCLGPIGVADPCWVPYWVSGSIDPDIMCYPFITSKRLFLLRKTDSPTDASWRWLVQVDK